MRRYEHLFKFKVSTTAIIWIIIALDRQHWCAL